VADLTLANIQPDLYAFGADAFVSKLNSSGTGLVYSTLLGGSGYEAGIGIAVDSSGSAYVAGLTDSDDFPITAGALQTMYHSLLPEDLDQRPEHVRARRQKHHLLALVNVLQRVGEIAVSVDL
jgi:hypothetical protein